LNIGQQRQRHPEPSDAAVYIAHSFQIFRDSCRVPEADYERPVHPALFRKAGQFYQVQELFPHSRQKAKQSAVRKHLQN